MNRLGPFMKLMESSSENAVEYKLFPIGLEDHINGPEGLAKQLSACCSGILELGS